MSFDDDQLDEGDFDDELEDLENEEDMKFDEEEDPYEDRFH